MHSKYARLDRYLSQKLGIKRGDVRLMLARGRVRVNGVVAVDINQRVGEFDHVVVDGQVLQVREPVYIMMHKPMGVVSATKDEKNKTVIDLLQRSDKNALHIAGRLDFNSTGLLLLTNDGRWSRRLSEPATKVMKWYRVRLQKPVTPDYIAAFAEGMYFSFEDITTLPAELKIVSDYVADVGLMEGRYHQIKRMFGRFQNPVLELHRMAVGNLQLDETLAAGESRELSADELEGI
ncbi:pseudouridine synthase [Dasania marina]|uniref:pseudouridine synthase n=1 Tax=Dasania marina TaxID=471499 RepID=UPI0003715096|nr:16S rRNA pseudouridine(516) synthase [Dasania marina]